MYLKKNQISEFESERRNQNTNKIKDSKYLKHNNQIQTFIWIYIRYLCLNHPINNINVKLDDVVHGNDISMHFVEVTEKFNNLSVVIATHWKTEIMIFIRKIIPKWWEHCRFLTYILLRSFPHNSYWKSLYISETWYQNKKK